MGQRHQAMTSAENWSKTAISTSSRSKRQKSEEKIVFSPLPPLNPLVLIVIRHQFSPDDNNALWREKIMITDTIFTKEKMIRSFIEFSQQIL